MSCEEEIEECESEEVAVMGVKRKSYRRRKSDSDHSRHSGFLRHDSKPSVYHAVVVIFLEFFAWGLLTTPMLTVLSETFGPHTFLINGLVQGIKGLLSFLAAPLLGALSDVWGRRMFLVLTVVCTCVPIPLMTISPWWFFALVSISGTCAVTFSIVFAYVADITDEEDRSSAYGLVSATFAASLVTSPAIGTKVAEWYGREVVVALASGIALLDVCFILIAVPESLPEKVRPSGWAHPISWDRVDPFSSLRQALGDPTNMLLCICVFLSYIPDAGQMSCIFLYLQQVIKFSEEKVTSFIAVCGVLSILAQTVLLTTLMQTTSKLTTIMVGLIFQTVQLFCYAFGRSEMIMWTAGAFYAVATITYPAISSLVSTNAELDQQGVVQGMVTGVRGLCTGLGPALFGLIFHIFGVNVEPDHASLVGPNHGGDPGSSVPTSEPAAAPLVDDRILPGPPFLFGGCSVILAIIIAALLPKAQQSKKGAKETPSVSDSDTESNKLLASQSI